jgi:hypothetical protein
MVFHADMQHRQGAFRNHPTKYPERKMFFSEEKNQKTLSLRRRQNPAMASQWKAAQRQKSFCFFFGRQKKSLVLF